MEGLAFAMTKVKLQRIRLTESNTAINLETTTEADFTVNPATTERIDITDEFLSVMTLFLYQWHNQEIKIHRFTDKPLSFKQVMNKKDAALAKGSPAAEDQLGKIQFTYVDPVHFELKINAVGTIMVQFNGLDLTSTFLEIWYQLLTMNFSDEYIMEKPDTGAIYTVLIPATERATPYV